MTYKKIYNKNKKQQNKNYILKTKQIKQIKIKTNKTKLELKWKYEK